MRRQDLDLAGLRFNRGLAQHPQRIHSSAGPAGVITPIDCSNSTCSSHTAAANYATATATATNSLVHIIRTVPATAFWSAARPSLSFNLPDFLAFYFSNCLHLVTGLLRRDCLVFWIAYTTLLAATTARVHIPIASDSNSRSRRQPRWHQQTLAAAAGTSKSPNPLVLHHHRQHQPLRTAPPPRPLPTTKTTTHSSQPQHRGCAPSPRNSCTPPRPAAPAPLPAPPPQTTSPNSSMTTTTTTWRATPSFRLSACAGTLQARTKLLAVEAVVAMRRGRASFGTDSTTTLSVRRRGCRGLRPLSQGYVVHSFRVFLFALADGWASGLGWGICGSVHTRKLRGHSLVHVGLTC